MNDDLAAFPYVNGGLFADEDIIIPRLDEEIVDLILRRASEDFDWSEISCTIFGAVFESTLNPETRRSGGMHYTSIENIHNIRLCYYSQFPKSRGRFSGARSGISLERDDLLSARVLRCFP